MTVNDPSTGSSGMMNEHEFGHSSVAVVLTITPLCSAQCSQPRPFWISETFSVKNSNFFQSQN